MLGKTGCSRLHPRSLFDGNTRRARDLLERDHPATGIRMERADGERFRAKRIPETSRDRAIKDTLYEGGALYAAMSGSGSSVFVVRKTNPFQGTIPVQRLFSMGRTIIMNQIETFLIRWRNAGTLSAYMIRERSGRYWIVPTCGRTPHPRCRLRHGILESYLLPYEPRQIVAIDIAGQMIGKARMNIRIIRSSSSSKRTL